MTGRPAAGYRLPPVTGYSGLSPHACARARDGAYTPKPGNQPVTGNFTAPPAKVTILRHCRCIDCGRFSREGGTCFCEAGIGGMGVVWATGERVCRPEPDQWHYCAEYDGPRISGDVFVWRHEQGGESHDGRAHDRD